MKLYIENESNDRVSTHTHTNTHKRELTVHRLICVSLSVIDYIKYERLKNTYL